MDIDNNVKKIKCVIKSQILKNLTVENQQKYAKLDKYLENINDEDFNRYISSDCIMYLEPYDRILFSVFLSNY